MQSINRFIIPAILVCHILFTLFSAVSLFSDFQGYTLYHTRPLYLLLYTFVWWLIVRKMKWAVIVYFLLTFFDAACAYVYPNTPYGDALENTLFPISLVFLASIVLLYKSHFQTKHENQ